jgi:hypothetical protein
MFLEITRLCQCERKGVKLNRCILKITTTLNFMDSLCS